MESELISKKELLELSDISYGQLYRWKRKNLIPEEWFIRKSVSTGQETFFPRDKILQRVDKIKNMKEGSSLDDMAGVFSPLPAAISLDGHQVVERGIASRPTLEFFTAQLGARECFQLPGLLILFLLEKLLGAGEISIDEGKLITDTYSRSGTNELEKGELILARKHGISFCVISSSQGSTFLDSGVKVVSRQGFGALIEEIKTQL